MEKFLIILMTSVLVNNYVLSRFLGICPFLGVSKKLNQAVGMGLSVTFVMLMSAAATYPIYTYLLVPNGMDYMKTIVFILVIAALVQLVEIHPALHLFLQLGLKLGLLLTQLLQLHIVGAELFLLCGKGFKLCLDGGDVIVNGIKFALLLEGKFKFLFGPGLFLYSLGLFDFNCLFLPALCLPIGPVAGIAQHLAAADLKYLL